MTLLSVFELVIQDGCCSHNRASSFSSSTPAAMCRVATSAKDAIPITLKNDEGHRVRSRAKLRAAVTGRFLKEDPLSAMLPKNSRNHHYIPRFYLRGFCRADGTFHVYDKRYAEFRKPPQSPGTAFFSKDRNNIKFQGAWTDKIEIMYATLESDLGRLFSLLRQGTPSNEVLQPEGIYLLKLFIAIQFWRLPRMDDASEKFLLSRTHADIEKMCLLTTPPMPSERVYELIQSDKGFRHYFRSFWLPLTTFDRSKRILGDESWTLLDVKDSNRWANHLCTDSPFIFLRPDDLFNFSAPFVLPLSGSRLLIARPAENTATSFDPSLSVRISILMYLQATRFVAGMSREYMEKIIELSHHYGGIDGTKRLEEEVRGFLQ
jgi:hypothetical protein